MTATVIQFPIDTDSPPRPFRPSAAVRVFLVTTKCNAVISARIPWNLKRFLMSEAYESDARFSEHIARILAEHVVHQGLHRLKKAA